MSPSESPAPHPANFIPLMRELARAYQRFALFDGELHRRSGSGLTAPQAKVIFCLGNTEGLTCGEISAQTLITKGTLTGIIDRLEEKGLVQRWGDTDDGRRIIVDLTRVGERVYEREYPLYLAALAERFALLGGPKEVNESVDLLGRIADLF